MTKSASSGGPLSGLTIIEISAIGPVPFAGMVLSDLGASVIRVDRLDRVDQPTPPPVERGRKSIALDLKTKAGQGVVIDLIREADGLIEGFRPGVMEALGLGPDQALEVNATLVYGRMTGWGQVGPLSKSAGHDLNYIAISGALGHMGREGEPPQLPLNLVGDYGGGGMLLVVGMLAGILEASRSGLGQIVDAAMVDGSALLLAAACGYMADGTWTDRRGNNVLDGGAPFYNVYGTADGSYVTVGPIEERFHEILIERADIPNGTTAGRMDRSQWPNERTRLQSHFRSKTRDEWCRLLEKSDACFAPVLSIPEAAQHPHLVARSTYLDIDGVLQPAPAPRFSRTPGTIEKSAPKGGEDSLSILSSLGYDQKTIDELLKASIVRTSGDTTS